MEHYSEYKDNGVKWDIPMHNGLNMNVPDGNGVKGQNHEQCCMAFALTGRMYPPSITQGVALGWKLVALSGRHLPTHGDRFDCRHKPQHPFLGDILSFMT